MMSYAHAIDLAADTDLFDVPVWLVGLCNADFIKVRPNFAKNWNLENVYLRPDGTLYELLEEE
jgi:hypothetical protein